MGKRAKEKKAAKQPKNGTYTIPVLKTFRRQTKAIQEAYKDLRGKGWN